MTKPVSLTPPPVDASVAPSLNPGTEAGPGGRETRDREIAELAAAQHGVVSRAQLHDLGLSNASIRRRVGAARLHEVHIGVYAVGHRLLSPRGWWMAAVLAGGPGALLGHRAAAALRGLIDRGPATVDVLVLRNRRPDRGFRPRRVRAIPDVDRDVVDGIPCTSTARTLVDLASQADERTLDRALRRAEDQRIFDRFAIDEVLRRRLAGTAALRDAVAVLAADEQARRRTKHELEARFLDLMRRHGFLLPCTNAQVETPWRAWEVDALWPDEHLVVELDGWWAHRDRESFRRDHRRDADLRAAGYAVTRLSWDQVVTHEDETLERLVRILPRSTSP